MLVKTVENAIKEVGAIEVDSSYVGYRKFRGKNYAIEFYPTRHGTARSLRLLGNFIDFRGEVRDTFHSTLCSKLEIVLGVRYLSEREVNLLAGGEGD